MKGMKDSGDETAAQPNHIHAYCARCRHRHIFVRASVNHPIHLLLSIATLGIWLVSWAAICIGNVLRPWRCEHCGWHKPEFRMHRDFGEKNVENAPFDEVKSPAPQQVNT